MTGILKAMVYIKDSSLLMKRVAHVVGAVGFFLSRSVSLQYVTHHIAINKILTSFLPIANQSVE